MTDLCIIMEYKNCFPGIAKLEQQLSIDKMHFAPHGFRNIDKFICEFLVV